jgi:cytidylate kinase
MQVMPDSLNSKVIPVVTIDGPSGVGKGTLAQYLTCKTGFHLLDSGAIYRALAFGAVKNGLDATALPGLVNLALNLPVEFMSTSILYDGVDVTTLVRTEEIAAVASTLAAIPEVRSALLARQKAFAHLPGLIADGRDMGTVVFPDAPVKLYLTASAEIRAQRRVNQLKNQGLNANIRQITQDIQERDDRDLNRAVAPLKPAEDAVVLDTTHLSIEDVCQQAMSLLWQKGLMK